MLLLTALVCVARAASVQAEVFTSFPTTIGVRSTLEGPGRLRLTASGGIFPAPYLRFIDETAVKDGWYGQDTADLIETILHNSVLFSVHAGWRPFPKLGLQMEAGYGFVGLGGGLTGARVISEVSGYDLSGLPDAGYNYSATATLHRVEASVGWDFVYREHLLVRLDVGYSRTVGAQSQVSPDFSVPFWLAPLEDYVEEDAEDKLEADLVGFVHTPILALGVGYRL